jgi:uncharacterized protein (TIGR02145 family)
MKNLYATLLLISLGIFAQLSAQTLKNIHRHNLPVLQIPIDLIDKVETVDVAGQKYLHVIQFNGFVNEVPVAQIDSITHTDGTAMDPQQLGNLRMGSVMGEVRDTGDAPIINALVRSPYGGEETRTDANGVFFFNDIIVYDKLGYITIEKPGYHKGSRSFLPLQQGDNRVNVQLLPLNLTSSFNASSGGSVSVGLMQLYFPANVIQRNGQPYSGTVRVYAAALNPLSTEMLDQMPGELLGGLNDSLRMLRSFGMASIELRDVNYQMLQLIEDSSVVVRFSIPQALQAEAPDSIDWWSFDESLGFWKHEGVAQKQGVQYIGAASHFSWWNVDIPENFNNFQGVVNTVGSSPVSDAQINVISPTMGTGTIYSNAEGIFTCRVPKNQSLALNVNLTCSTTSDWALMHTQTINSGSQPINTEITVDLQGRFPIKGTVVNCQQLPISKGYVKLGRMNYFTRNGLFVIQTCAIGAYTIRGFDVSIPDSIKGSELVNVQVESTGVDSVNIEACQVIFGKVADIDGNVYQTMRYGNQWWTIENLKTTRFEEGSVIQNVTNNASWPLANAPAWCYSYNNLVFGDMYGKIYNWLTVSDSRNLCPAGWHAPTDAEWTILVNQLGGAPVAGGKMKSTTGWNLPNIDATNESGFTALPGGFRFGSGSNGAFSNLLATANWWTSSQFSALLAYTYTVTNSSGASERTTTGKDIGFYVRCLKD